MCGSSSAQNQIERGQQSLFQTLSTEAGQVFGENSALYSDMTKELQQVFDKGPGQEGFSAQEKTALNTQSTEGVSQSYQNAEKTIRERYAGSGGGNDYVPAGQEEEIASQVAESAAGEEANQANQITEADYETGRQNWLSAESGLMNAGSVFAPSESMFGEATGAGTAAANTANQIAQADNSWEGAVGGMIGSAVGGWATGGFKMPGG